MAGVVADLEPQFAYTVVYMKDVDKSAEFYSKAFSFNIRRLNNRHRYEKKYLPLWSVDFVVNEWIRELELYIGGVAGGGSWKAYQRPLR